MKKIYSLGKTIVDVETLDTIEVPQYRFFSSLQAAKLAIEIMCKDVIFIKETESFLQARECSGTQNTYYFVFEHDLED